MVAKIPKNLLIDLDNVGFTVGFKQSSKSTDVATQTEFTFAGTLFHSGDGEKASAAVQGEMTSKVRQTYL